MHTWPDTDKSTNSRFKTNRRRCNLPDCTTFRTQLISHAIGTERRIWHSRNTLPRWVKRVLHQPDKLATNSLTRQSASVFNQPRLACSSRTIQQTHQLSHKHKTTKISSLLHTFVWPLQAYDREFVDPFAFDCIFTVFPNNKVTPGNVIKVNAKTWSTPATDRVRNYYVKELR